MVFIVSNIFGWGLPNISQDKLEENKNLFSIFSTTMASIFFIRGVLHHKYSEYKALFLIYFVAHLLKWQISRICINGSLPRHWRLADVFRWPVVSPLPTTASMWNAPYRKSLTTLECAIKTYTLLSEHFNVLSVTNGCNMRMYVMYRQKNDTAMLPNWLQWRSNIWRAKLKHDD